MSILGGIFIYPRFKISQKNCLSHYFTMTVNWIYYLPWPQRETLLFFLYIIHVHYIELHVENV